MMKVPCAWPWRKVGKKPISYSFKKEDSMNYLSFLIAIVGTLDASLTTGVFSRSLRFYFYYETFEPHILTIPLALF